MISLSCKVGRTSPPPILPSSVFVSSPRHRSPSYFRRQVRRKAYRDSQVNNIGLEHSCEVTGQLSEVDDDVNGECLPAGNAETSADDKNSSILLNDDQAEVVENVDENSTEEVEVDQDELERDKIIEEVIVSSVTKPIEKEKDVEQEIIKKFGEIGIVVKEMKTFSDYQGNFDKSRV